MKLYFQVASYVKQARRALHVGVSAYKRYSLSVEIPDCETIPTTSGVRSRCKPAGVVLLFGWTGSTEKQLQKYSDIYLKRGEAVVKYCPSPGLIYKLNVRRDYDEATRDCLQLLREKRLDKRDMLFHCLSNGGLFMFNAFVRELLRSGNVTNIRGTVYDSTPSLTGYHLVKGSISRVAPGNALVKNILGVAGLGWVYFALSYNYLVDFSRGRELSRTENYRIFVYHSVAKLPNLGPELFLFSKTDKVTRYQQVIDFMQKRKALGIDVRCRMWDDSDHVKHFLSHPDEYENLISDMVRLTPTRVQDQPRITTITSKNKYIAFR